MNVPPPITLHYQRPITDGFVSGWRPLIKVIAIVSTVCGLLETTGGLFSFMELVRFCPFSIATLSFWSSIIAGYVRSLALLTGGILLLLNFKIGRILVVIAIALGVYLEGVFLYDYSTKPRLYSPNFDVASVIAAIASFLIFSVFACIILFVPKDAFAKPRPADFPPLPT